MLTKTRRAWRLAVIALSASALAPSLGAQAKGKALDRTVEPIPAPKPAIRVPVWSRSTLPNGAQLIVSQKHDLPLVSVSVNFVGGTTTFEDPSRAGVADLTAQMLSEGTTTRTGDQLSNAQQLLGTQIRVSIDDESGRVSFAALQEKLEPALELVADMLLNSTFAADALERRRAQALVQLTQQKEEPRVIAANVFSKVVYGDDHPYGRLRTENSLKSITRDDVANFARQYFQPGRAIITVVGDFDQARARAAVEKAFAKWTSGGSKPVFSYPAPPAARSLTIYLVDKPKAPQSVFAIGLVGPARNTPDYYALEVMNTILGGLFQSRLNHLIREVKGYSYGVGSNFSFGRGPGPFRAGGSIVAPKTDSALIDFMNELRGVQGSKPFTEDEIKQGKESLVQGLVTRFENVQATGSSISSLYVQDLPENFFQDYGAKINAVTADDLTRVAKKYLDIDHMDIVIVGDRAVIEEPLRKTGIAPIVLLNIEAKPVAAVKQ